MQGYLTGLITGLSLIVAIGAQNAFVLRQGLLRQRVLLVVLICSFSDALLIALGVLGLGNLINSLPVLLEIIRWFGVAFLLWFGFQAFRRVLKAAQLKASDTSTATIKATVLATLGLTFLNPHVYLDTVIFIGGLAHQFGSNTWLFAIGSITASFLWFFSLGFGATKLAPLMAKPLFWKILDGFIALVMLSVAIALAVVRFN